jgi:nucleoside-diphosphate-sugar epimerase
MTVPILIIGGGNFMGHALLELFLHDKFASRFDVTVVSRDREHWGEHVSRHAAVSRHIACDRRDKYAFLHALSDALSTARPWRFCIDFCAYDLDDVQPLANFLQSISCHYVFISTDSVYEVCDTPLGVARLESHALLRPTDVEERKRLRRGDTYGDDKLLCEEWLAESHAVTFTAFRLPDVFGPRDGTKRHWSYQVLVKISDERAIELTPSERTRPLSFVFCRDVARAVVAVLEQPERCANTSFNLACDERPTIEEYLAMVAAALGKPRLNVRELGADDDNATQFLPSVSVRAGVLDCELAKRQFGFRPTPLVDALRETVEWHERAWTKHKDERPDLKGDVSKEWRRRIAQIYNVDTA